MAHNFYIKCPICGSVTRLDADMAPIHDTPIRIHCGRCGILLAGTLLYENEEFYFSGKNFEEVYAQSYDFYGQISGILPCMKIIENHESHPLLRSDHSGFDLLSTTMEALDSILNSDKNDSIIEVAKSINNISENWSNCRMIFDLYLGGKFEYIRDYYSASTGIFSGLGTNRGIVQHIGFQYRFLTGRFLKKDERSIITKLCAKSCGNLNHDAMKHFLNEYATEERLLNVQKSLFTIMNDYMSVAKYLIPAISMFRSGTDNKEKIKSIGMSTCTFGDISQYFQDTFERLTDCIDIVVGLDNIYEHQDYNHVTWYIKDNKYKPENLTALMKIKKGGRVRYLHDDCPFAHLFAFDAAFFDIRNGIGHSSFSYDEQQQLFRYKSIKKYLVEIAVKCLEMTRSAVVLSAYVEFLLVQHIDRKQITDS